MHSILDDKKLAQILPDAIIELDELGRIIWWNKAAEKLFLLDKKRHHLIDATTLINEIQVDKQLVSPRSFETHLNLFNANKIRIDVAILPYEQHYILVARDITTLHLLGKMRQDFVANVSHELRTPLTVIRGYLEILIEQEPAHREIFTQMHAQSSRMEKIIEDLLLLSHLEADRPTQHRKKISVAKMLATICEEAKILSGERGHHISLHADTELKLKGNEHELRSAFSNLIFNAVHYTPVKGSIEVSWNGDVQGKYLTVQDNGIGIDKKHINRITERFYRVDKARSRDSGGTGLGLAIAKHVLIRHGGHLVIESKLGEGSKFICVFPPN